MKKREDLELELRKLWKLENFTRHVVDYMAKRYPDQVDNNTEYALDRLLFRVNIKKDEDPEEVLIKATARFVRAAQRRAQHAEATVKAEKKRHRDSIKAMLAAKGNRW